MSWKEDLAEIKEQNQTMVHLLQVLQGQTAINGKRIEALKIMIDSQVQNQSRAADRMADRMIEMAMVNRGSTVEAASHRRTLQESEPEGTDLWQDNPETQWPPPGCDAINMP